MIIFSRMLLFCATILGGSAQKIEAKCSLLKAIYLYCNDINQTPVTNWSFEKQDEFNWGEIQDLWVRRNRIKSFKNGIFSKFTNVREIYLLENELSAIDFNEFANNSKLTNLYVSSNKIFDIKPIKKSIVSNITKLWANNNVLTDISELCKLKKLELLSLNGNRRLDYSKVMFRCWSELTTLGLADTNLKRLNHNYRMLAGCNNVKDIFLMDNDLEMLCLEYFPALSKLNALFIHNNSMIALDVLGLKRKFQKLSIIMMTGNKWSCDYYEETLKKQLNKSNIIEYQGLRAEIKDVCLADSVNLEARNCPKTESARSIFVVFWIFLVLICIVFTTEAVLLRYYTQFFNFDVQV